MNRAESFPNSSREEFEGEAATVEEKEVYENPEDDPVVKEVGPEITRRTNRFIEEAQSGKWGAISQREADSQNFSFRHQRRNEMAEWESFVLLNPEKAEAYSDYEPVKEARERIERRNKQYEERQRREKEERERKPDSLDEDPRFRNLIDDGVVGANARVWADVPRSELISINEYEKRRKEVEAEMRREFIEEHPDIAEKYGETVADGSPAGFEVSDEIEDDVRAEPIFSSREFYDFIEPAEAQEEAGNEESETIVDDDQNEVSGFISLFDSLKEPARFSVEPNTLKQQFVEILKEGNELVVISRNYRSPGLHERRWRLRPDGSVDFTETIPTETEKIVPAGIFQQRQVERGSSTNRKKGDEALEDLKALLRSAPFDIDLAA